MKKLFIRIFILVSLLVLTACGCKESKSEKSTKTPNSVVGKWYEVQSEDYIEIWEFLEDGKLNRDAEEYFKGEGADVVQKLIVE